jgi:hypothetical protein
VRRRRLRCRLLRLRGKQVPSVRPSLGLICSTGGQCWLKYSMGGTGDSRNYSVHSLRLQNVPQQVSAARDRAEISNLFATSAQRYIILYPVTNLSQSSNSSAVSKPSQGFGGPEIGAAVGGAIAGLIVGALAVFVVMRDKSATASRIWLASSRFPSRSKSPKPSNLGVSKMSNSI